MFNKSKAQTGNVNKGER